MTRRSDRLNRYISKTQMVINPLRDMMDAMFVMNNVRAKLKCSIEMMEYIIIHFYELCEAYKKHSPTAFTKFAQVVYDKFKELLESGKTYVQNGERIKTSLKRLQYLQKIYTNIYTEYYEQLLLNNRSNTITTLMDKKKRISDKNCMEMKKYIKIFLVGNISLCKDVLEIIKSYLFYDVKTFAQISFAKQMKTNIVKLIDGALQSRKNGFAHDGYEHDEEYHEENQDILENQAYEEYDEEYDEENQAYEDQHHYPEDTDEVEHWSFCINGYEVAFQSVNCRFCGNYWPQYAEPWAPHNILCYCE